MKFAIPFVALALTAVPASAEVIQRTAVAHNGRTVAVSYEPTVEASLRQANIGPRSNMACQWTSTVSVRRTAADADGRPIAALQRVITGGATRSGQYLGPCAGVSDAMKVGFAGGDEVLRTRAAAAADEDAQRLRTELASLALLSGGESHAR